MWSWGVSSTGLPPKALGEPPSLPFPASRAPGNHCFLTCSCILQSFPLPSPGLPPCVCLWIFSFLVGTQSLNSVLTLTPGWSHPDVLSWLHVPSVQIRSHLKVLSGCGLYGWQGSSVQLMTEGEDCPRGGSSDSWVGSQEPFHSCSRADGVRWACP